MSLDSIFQVTMKTSNVSVGKKGFGVPLLLARHAFWPQTTRVFGALSELVTAGVPTTHPLYKMALAVKSPEPNPPTFVVAKRSSTANVQTITLTPKASPVALDVYSMNLSVNGLVSTAISFTADATPTVAEICAGLFALINPLAGIDCTNNTTNISITTTTLGDVIQLEALTQNFDIADVSADPGIAADLAAALISNASFYQVAIDRQSKAEIVAAQVWCEANKKPLFASTGDTACKDPVSTTDVAYTLKASTYAQGLLTFSDNPGQYPALSIAALQAPKPPGSSNYAWKQAAGPTATVLTEAEQTALDAKNCNYFTTLNSVTSFFWGKSPSGEWIDITIGAAWFQARLQERLHALQLNSEKIDYDADGIDLLVNQLRAQIKDAMRARIIDPLYPVVIEVPTIDEISSADFASRTLPLVKAKARLRGAINKASFEITLYQ